MTALLRQRNKFWTIGPFSLGSAPAAVASSKLVCLSGGTVTRTITPAQVLAQDAQGFEAGDFDELVRAIRNGAAYANVHWEKFTAGESVVRLGTTGVETIS